MVARLRAAGALVMGKTVTTELAAFTPGKTRNPWDKRRTPGGSSSGSAAAVASGMVPLALGSQTNGSVIRPASYCGIYGFKPSFGLIDREGMTAQAPSVDHVGCFARSLADIALVADVLAGQPTGSSAFRDALGQRPDAAATARLRQGTELGRRRGRDAATLHQPGDRARPADGRVARRRSTRRSRCIAG